MRILDNADWGFPVPIHYGPGRIRELPALCARHGIRNPLIVTDRGSSGLPFFDTIRRALAKSGIGHVVYSDFSPDPVDEEVVRAKPAVEQGGHDAVIAVGGGSGMDAGKATSLLAGRDMSVWDFEFGDRPKACNGFPPLVCIPTTAGTGAETESTAMITDTRRGIKGCVWHPGQKPVAAILDPELTLELPRNLTAWTGCDALTHAIEAYVVPSFDPLCDGAALEALRLIGTALPRVVTDPRNLEARAAMLVGSCLAGVSFLKGLGLVHSISHMIGAIHGTHHGLTNAILLPPVLRFNRNAIEDKCPAMIAALGMSGNSAAELETGICAVLDRLDIPDGLGAIGVPGDQSREIARKASNDPATGTNPRESTVDEIEAIFLEALATAR